MSARPPDDPAERDQRKGRNESDTERGRASKRDELQARMEVLWEGYGSVVEERVQTLEAFVDKVRTGAATPADVHAAHALAHMLTGSLGIFGFPEGSEAARGVLALLAGREEIAGPDVDVLSELVAALRTAVSLPRDRA